MKDTIDLLQAIGQDASLRHASGEQLARTLAGMHASEALVQAAMSGSAEPLAQEFGPMDDNKVTHSPTQSPCTPDQDGDGDGEGLPQPLQDGLAN